MSGTPQDREDRGRPPARAAAAGGAGARRDGPPHWARVAAGVSGRGPAPGQLRKVVAGRIVLVTGASEGIGAATARMLAAAGASVLLVARTAERLEAVRAEILAAGGTAYVHPADLSVPEQAAALATEVLARHGRVDIVVSNAGRSIRRSLADTADRFHDVQRLIAVNHLGPVQLLLGLLPAMRAAGRGHIVNVSTAALGVPAANWSTYLSSKGAFDTWLRCAAPELRLDGVTVSTVHLGLVRTRMSAPTAHYRRMPAMSPDEAAAVVCRAVVRPRRWYPWWSRSGVVLSAILPGTAERVAAGLLRASRTLEPAAALVTAGLWRPARLLRILRAAARFGPTLAGAVAAGPPGAVAVLDGDGPVRYEELDRAALACALAAGKHLHAGAGSRIGVHGLDGRHLVAALAGIARLGADAVLLPPDLPAGRRAEVLAGAGITGILHRPAGSEHATTTRAATTRQEWGGLPALGWSWPEPLPAPPRGPRGPRSPRRRGRVIVLTSGTTGLPRAVSHRLPLHVLVGPVTTHLRLVPLRAGEPIVLAAPLHHGYGLAYLAAGLALGCPVVLAAGASPEQVLRAATAHTARLLVLLPIQLRRICDLPPEVLERYPPDRLRAVLSGAAPLPVALHARAVRVFGERIFDLFGSTEAGWAGIATPADLRAAPGTLGRPPRGIRLRILDGSGRPVANGAVGEVQVHGWDPRGRWVPTGDLGHLDPAGRLFLDGRVDDMVVSGGENVYPAPVLATITAHPDVEDAVLTPVPDEEFGQRLHATVSLRPGSALTAAQLREWLRGRLSRAELPRDITVVDALERTSTGKPRRPDVGR